MNFVVHELTPKSLAMYLDIVRDVFHRVEPRRLEENTERFVAETRFYAAEADGVYVSVLFVTPIEIGGCRFGGVGGVCTRAAHRGKGYGREIVSRAVAHSVSRFDVLLLWTRIPEYFARFGFIDATAAFKPDPGGSTPMMLLHQPSEFAVALPRVYF